MASLANLGLPPTDPIAWSIADRSSRSRAARTHIRELAGDLARLSALEPSPQLRDYLDKIGDLLAALDAAWVYQPNESFRQRAVVVETLLEAGANGYQRLANAEGLSSIEKSRRSRVGLLLGDALCTLRTGIPGADSMPNLTSLNGSGMCSSTGGGTPPSLHRNINVLDQITQANTNAAIGARVTGEAQTQVVVLRVDPLAVPSSTGVVDALYLISKGVVSA